MRLGIHVCSSGSWLELVDLDVLLCVTTSRRPTMCSQMRIDQTTCLRILSGLRSLLIEESGGKMIDQGG